MYKSTNRTVSAKNSNNSAVSASNSEELIHEAAVGLGKETHMLASAAVHVEVQQCRQYALTVRRYAERKFLPGPWHPGEHRLQATSSIPAQHSSYDGLLHHKFIIQFAREETFTIRQKLLLTAVMSVGRLI